MPSWTVRTSTGSTFLTLPTCMVGRLELALQKRSLADGLCRAVAGVGGLSSQPKSTAEWLTGRTSRGFPLFISSRRARQAFADFKQTTSTSTRCTT